MMPSILLRSYIKFGDNIDNDYYDHDHDEFFYVTVYKPKQSVIFSQLKLLPEVLTTLNHVTQQTRFKTELKWIHRM